LGGIRSRAIAIGEKRPMEDHKENPAGTTDPRKGRHLARNDFFILLDIVTRHCFFFLLGIAGLLLVFWYSGPFFNLVHSYGGNLTASFAFYFIVRSIGAFHSVVTPAATRLRSNRTTSLLITLLVAELFEATDGFFGIMTNVYDPLDYLVNALGVALAVAGDVVATYVSNSRKRRIRDAIQDHPHDSNAT